MTNREDREAHHIKSEVNWQYFLKKLSEYQREDHAEADKNLLKW